MMTYISFRKFKSVPVDASILYKSEPLYRISRPFELVDVLNVSIKAFSKPKSVHYLFYRKVYS